MESLANLEAFARSAQSGSFSAAARSLGLTPAAVSRNVATLERNLGVRLFQRSTRKLRLTDSGERFLTDIGPSLETLQSAIAEAGAENAEPHGPLKVSLSPTFGVEHILPLLPEFVAKYPKVRIEWRFENRQADLIAEGFDAAVGGGFELAAGLVARPLAPLHVVPVASPAYMKGRSRTSSPDALSKLDGIVMRSLRTGRVRQWTLRNVAGEETSPLLAETFVFNEPAAIREAAALGLGVAMMAMPDISAMLTSGELIRLAPRWYADAGSISLYYPSKTLVPARTRVFVEFILEAFRRKRLARRFAGSLG